MFMSDIPKIHRLTRFWEGENSWAVCIDCGMAFAIDLVERDNDFPYRPYLSIEYTTTGRQDPCMCKAG